MQGSVQSFFSNSVIFKHLSWVQFVFVTSLWFPTPFSVCTSASIYSWWYNWLVLFFSSSTLVQPVIIFVFHILFLMQYFIVASLLGGLQLLSFNEVSWKITQFCLYLASGCLTCLYDIFVRSLFTFLVSTSAVVGDCLVTVDQCTALASFSLSVLFVSISLDVWFLLVRLLFSVLHTVLVFIGGKNLFMIARSSSVCLFSFLFQYSSLISLVVGLVLCSCRGFRQSVGAHLLLLQYPWVVS